MTEGTAGKTGTQDTTELKVERTEGDMKSWNERQTEEGMKNSWKAIERAAGGGAHG